MGYSSKIEWTDATWNPVTGCTKISEGCKNCYAERLALRLKAMKNPRYEHGFDIKLHYDLLDTPLRWKTPRMIFVNSMSDIFHEAIPVSYIEDIFTVMRKASHHVFQVLTKRSARMVELSSRLTWPQNIWMGVTVESQRYLGRIHDLETIPARVRFLSIEPLLSPVERLPLGNLDWVVVGGESGKGCREINPDWVRSIREQCLVANVPFFFKQWGGVRKHLNGRMLDGKIWDEMPKIRHLTGGGDGAGLDRFMVRD